MPRLFVAVRPPANILDRAAALARPDEAGVRYTTRQQWHVTLRFLGEAGEGEVTEALARVRASASRATVGPQVTRLGRSVVVVPVAGLDALADDVGRATAALGEPPEARPFRGHLTLARLRGRGAGLIGAPIDGTFVVSEIELVRSHLHRKGARYETVGRFELAQP